MKLFPAVLIGGPPNSGKSVLTANLTQALRERGVPHYVLRACPDGEGDWTHLADQDLVRTILVPRRWTPAFVTHICQDLERRHLPLIVDAGGRPQPWQEAILDYCTHAILLTPDGASRATWRSLAGRHGLLLLADLHSQLHGESRIFEQAPVLRGTLAGLEWGRHLEDALFHALVARLARVFAYDAQELRRAHLLSAPAETTLDLDRLARTLGVPHLGEQPIWAPEHLPLVVDYLPEGIPLALYGRGPNWLYAAVALLADPSPFFQFDVRLGWVQATPLLPSNPEPTAPLQFRISWSARYVHVQGLLPGAYLDYRQIESLAAPPPPPDSGVILSGQLPLWLYTGLALSYRNAPWIAVYQPPLGCAVVVHSTVETRTLGNCIHGVEP